MSTSLQAKTYAPGKTLLLVVSIIFIVFGALGIAFAAMGLAGTAALVTMMGAAAAFEIVYNVISLTVSIIMLITGILGIKKSSDTSKA